MAKAKQPTPRQIANRMNGRLGGLKRAKNLSKEVIQEIGRKGGQSTLKRYGVDFFSFAVSKRKVVGRYRTAVS